MSIADKLTAIAENTPKVYEAGYKKAVDELCPPINETGLVVQCCPLGALTIENVGSMNTYTTVTICGKNLYDAAAYPLNNNQIIRHEYGTYASSNTFAATEKYIPCAHLQGQTISIRHAPRITENNNNTGGGIAFYKEDRSYLSGANTSQVTVPAEAAFFRFCINVDYAHEAQIELGSVLTKYEPYAGKKIGIAVYDELPKEIEPFEGINTIFAYDDDAGVDGEDLATEVSVTGITDPKAVLDRLNEYLGAAASASV
jgi:hypothetical protein